jgi:lipopolysaccharide transport system ATP-binding protein
LNQDPTATVFHLTHHKAGSQWVRRVLAEAAPTRIMLPRTPRLSGVVDRVVLPGMIYPTVYLTREEFGRVRRPDGSILFVVIRDLRDVLVSAYFSAKVSHVETHMPLQGRMQAQLEARSLEEGLRLVLHTWLPPIARFQLSWIHAGEHLLRYEEILADELAAFSGLLAHCGIQLAPSEIRQIVARCSFERWSGRPRGVEDPSSHHRKGVAGDWRTYFTPALIDEFKSLYDDVLIETGYERTRDWGGPPAPAPRGRAESSSPSCWCGPGPVSPFGPAYSRCVRCGTLISNAQCELARRDPAVTAGFYGPRYWNDPAFVGPRYLDQSEYLGDGEGFTGSLDEYARVELAHGWTLRRVELLLRCAAPPARVLDVGCGTGAFAGLARAAGFDVVGLELHPAIANFAQRTFELPVHVGALRDHADLQPFDVITLWHVLEQVPDPVGLLEQCRARLAPGGRLLLRTPRLDDGRGFDELRSAGSPFVHALRPDEHVYLFSRAALEQALARAGFGSVSFAADPFVVAAREPALDLHAGGSRDEPASLSARLVWALLQQQHELALVPRWRRDDWLITDEQLRLARMPSPDAALLQDVLQAGAGWGAIETQAGRRFCWIANDAELIVAQPTGRVDELALEIEPGPSLGGAPLRLELRDERGATIGSATAIGRTEVRFKLPIVAGRGTRVWLHVDGGGLPVPNDPRVLNFRVFAFGWAASLSSVPASPAMMDQ